jgi:hypothetical protein
MNHAVEQGNVSAWVKLEVDTGKSGKINLARVRNDEVGTFFSDCSQNAPPDEGVLFSGIRPDDKYQFCIFNLIDGIRHRTAAK